MALVKRLISRLRNRRGFGVHSPFAFDFIMHTLRSDRRYRYYGSEGMTRRQRLLYRVLVRLHPSAVELHGDCSELAPLLQVLDTRSAAAMEGRRDMGAGLPLAVLGAGCDSLPAAPGQANVLVLRPKCPASRRLWKTLLHEAPHGMSFSRRGLRVFVADQRLTRQDFRV